MLGNSIPNFDLDGRVAVITGAAGGMGRASAIALAGYGARVAVLDVNETGVEETAAQIGPSAQAYKCDVGDPCDVEMVIGRIRDDLGPISILHNNAAVNMGWGAGDERAGDLSLEVWGKTISVNLDGVFYVTKFAVPDMLAQGRGSIINSSSIAGPFIGSQNTAYTSAKGGVVGFTRALVISYAGTGIRANAICPGFFLTPMADRMLQNPVDMERYASQIPVGRHAEPQDIGGLVVFLASDASAYVNGAVISIDGGISLQ
jgi:NAD(P)-dependent dehydrogenase (short-subunit alcohol dehydrogenase family)